MTSTPRGRHGTRDSDDAPLLASPSLPVNGIASHGPEIREATDVGPPARDGLRRRSMSGSLLPDVSAPGGPGGARAVAPAQELAPQHPCDEAEDSLLKSPAMPPSWARRCAMGDTPPMAKLLEPPPLVDVCHVLESIENCPAVPAFPLLPTPSPDRYRARSGSRARSVPPPNANVEASEVCSNSAVLQELSYVEQEQEIARFLGDLGEEPQGSLNFESQGVLTPRHPQSGAPQAPYQPVLDSAMWRSSCATLPAARSGTERTQSEDAAPSTPPRGPVRRRPDCAPIDASPEATLGRARHGSFQRSFSADCHGQSAAASRELRPAQSAKPWGLVLQDHADDVEEVNDEELLKCHYCNRRFRPNRLAIHENVCDGKKKEVLRRPKFDSRRQRCAETLNSRWWMSEGSEGKVSTSIGSTAAPGKSAETCVRGRSARTSMQQQQSLRRGRVSPVAVGLAARSPPTTPEKTGTRRLGGAAAESKVTPEKRSQSTPSQPRQQRKTPLPAKTGAMKPKPASGAVKANATDLRCSRTAPQAAPRTVPCSPTLRRSRSDSRSAAVAGTAGAICQPTSVGASIQKNFAAEQGSGESGTSRPSSANRSRRQKTFREQKQSVADGPACCIHQTSIEEGNMKVPPLPFAQPSLAAPAQGRVEQMPQASDPLAYVPSETAPALATRTQAGGHVLSTSGVGACAALGAMTGRTVACPESHGNEPEHSGQPTLRRASSSVEATESPTYHPLRGRSETQSALEDAVGTGSLGSICTLSATRTSDDSVLGPMLREVAQLGAQVDELIARREHMLRERPYDPSRYCEPSGAATRTDTFGREADCGSEDEAAADEQTRLSSCTTSSLDSAELQSRVFQERIRGCAQQIRLRRNGLDSWRQSSGNVERFSSM